MPPWASPLQSPSELQWDPDAAPDNSVNCGPSSAEKVANYFRSLSGYGITRTRKLGTTRVGTGTNTDEQKKMLDRRGVPCSVQRHSPSRIKEILQTGRRPLILWLLMSHIPYAVKGNIFRGRHAVTALSNATGVCPTHNVVETGIWVNEPNQRRERATYRANRFFPDHYWIAASSAMGRWVIVPDKGKVVGTRTVLVQNWLVATDLLNVRSAPTRTASRVSRLAKGTRFKSNLIEKAGGSYLYGTTTRRDWIGYILNGRQVWVARAFLKEV